MIDRLEILASRMRRLVSRNRWSAFLLGLPPAVGKGGEPGILLVQIDGLGHQVLRDAIDRGRMPFLARLEREERYRVEGLYSGVPSNTPGFEGEFYYGVRGAVPAFGYFDRGLRRVMSMHDPFAASVVETRLLRRRHGLLRHGSGWSNVFSGDAEEAHFCASTAGLDLLFRALNPLRLMGLVLWNLWSIVRVVFTVVMEFAVAIWDFLRRKSGRKDFLAELLFIPERVAVSAVMREVVTAGVCIDTERGMPIIHANLLGYDEHAHRRGPESAFALWTLRGIDTSIKRMWIAAHRARLRDYQVWIHSDHGQEATVPWPEAHGEPLAETVRRVVDSILPPEQPSPGAGGPSPVPSGTERSRWLSLELPDWLRWGGRTSATDPIPDPLPGLDSGRPDELTVLTQGPVGSVTLPQAVAPDVLAELASALARTARVPLVLFADEEGSVHVRRNDGGVFRLPNDAAEVFGPAHPHLDEVADDTLALVRHEHAGDLVLMGFDPARPGSLQFERGAHGGPGPNETSAFAMFPPEAPVPDRPLRPEVLRDLALRTLEGVVAEGEVPRDERHRPRNQQGRTLRILTYNVHGCRGMDGKYSPSRIARVIAREQPDVICLQELDHERDRSGKVNQADVIAEMLQVDYHFHAVAEIADGKFGNAVLSRFPLRQVASGPLPRWRTGMRLEDRGVLWVEVDVEGTPLHVLNTHLSILDHERRLQIDALLGERWLHHPRLTGPVVLCGDFNAAGRSRNLRRLDALLQNVGSTRPGDQRLPELNTWSSRLPMRRIDHVFINAELDVEGIHVPRSRLTRVASDHLPVVVDLWLPVNGAAG